MEDGTRRQDRLSDFERAICYYTLPEITHPVTLGLLLAYFVVLLEAILLLVWGAWSENISWTAAGVIAVVAAIVLGIVAFTARATLNEVRKRRALATAEGVPDPRLSDHDLTPDPFEHHTLLVRPRAPRSTSFECTDREGTTLYRVEKTGHKTWLVFRDGEEPWLTLRADRRPMSFTFEQRRTPGHLTVERDGERVAEIRLRYSLTKPTFTITGHGDGAHDYLVRRRGIYRGDTLVGRVFYLRQNLYLDVQHDALDPGILAYYIAIE